MTRREFLHAAAMPSMAFGQHPGFAPAAAGAIQYPEKLRYTVENGAVVGRNGTFYNSRPLYCSHGPGAVLGGDRPLLRLIAEKHVLGTFSVAIVRAGKGAWLQNWHDVRMEYRCGHIKWIVKDSAMPGVSVQLEAVPLADTYGFSARATITGARAGDQLIWAFGGAHPQANVMWAFDPVLLAQDDAWRGSFSSVLHRGVEAAMCRGNRFELDGSIVRLTAPESKTAVSIRCSESAEVRISDASAYDDPAKFARSIAAEWPLSCGATALSERSGTITWAVETAPRKPVAEVFDNALRYVESIGKRVVVRTPDPYLDAAMQAANHAVDSVYYPPVFRHGCMAWNVRLPGWRTVYAGTVLGWPERVREQAKFYIASQVKTDTFKEADSDPALRLCNESMKSRLWGKGRIVRDASRYDFQSQLFDQLIHAWRWTGSNELETILRPALELHAIWIRECFDPDDDGLYESYINTWPTDTVWYDGGGSVEESAYAYTVHRALRDMALKAGDSAIAASHAARMEKIRKAVFDVLWVKEKGHFAAYLEQSGHRRVHEDSWIYSQFLPVDAGMTTFEQSVQALFYTEWALENVRLKIGGRRVWSSNWVPSKWSARELYHGDNYHLALAYFQTGLAQDGYEILRGNLLDAGFGKVVPGGQALAEVGCDFNDVLGPFCRAVVEGLFGFAPDYPNGVVRVQPAFPAAWPNASIETPDYSLRFDRKGATDRYVLKLARAAKLDLRIPVRASGVRRVTLNGAEMAWRADAGAGMSIVRIDTAPLAEVELAIDWKASGVVPPSAAAPGSRILFSKVKTGDLEQWQIRKPRLSLDKPVHKQLAAAADARWEPVDFSSQFNCSVQGIYKQKYLSPRPKTVSVRIGVDGYSPWTFAPWKIELPVIDLANVKGRVITSQFARFAAPPPENNIAFTSLWDNFPRSVKVPVNRRAAAVWLLVCGSTNPMQTRIANAELRFTYADGATEKLELVPPLNFWSLCPLGGRDYLYPRDAFCLPAVPPPTVQLGANCRAMVYSHALRPGVPLSDVTLETLSREVVIGLMAVSLMNPA